MAQRYIITSILFDSTLPIALIDDYFLFTLPIAPAIEFKGNNERIKELEKSYNEAARLARALMRDEQCTSFISSPPPRGKSLISTPARSLRFCELGHGGAAVGHRRP